MQAGCRGKEGVMPGEKSKGERKNRANYKGLLKVKPCGRTIYPFTITYYFVEMSGNGVFRKFRNSKIFKLAPALFFIRSLHQASFLYSVGVFPVCALKKRTKCCGYSKPSSRLACVTLMEASVSSCVAVCSSRSLMKSFAVFPVSALTSAPKYFGE